MSETNRIWLNYYSTRLVLNLFRPLGVNGFIRVNSSIGILFALLFTISAWVDKSLVIQGRDIGLLEHPPIWCFLLIQIFAPILLEKTLSEFMKLNASIKGSNSFPGIEGMSFAEMIMQGSAHKAKLNQVIFRVITILAILGFIWNSFQNQQPLRFLGFDFWDSSNHPWSYWLTRVYKFIDWCMLIPILIHLQILIARQGIALIKWNLKSRFIKLEPYHSDRLGGYRKMISFIVRPLTPILILIGFATAAVIQIHEKIDITVFFGVFAMSTTYFVSYIFPSWHLRKLIIEEKTNLLNEIDLKQGEILNYLIKTKKTEFLSVDKNGELLNILSAAIEKIKKIPNWPLLIFAVSQLSIANIPPIVIMVLKTIGNEWFRQIFTK